MGNLLSMILSLFLFIPAFLCGADLLCIQNINTELDSLALTVSYKISKEGKISDETIALVNSFNIEIECRSSCNSNGIGDVMTYALIKSYTPLIISSEQITIEIVRTTMIGYY